MCGISGLIAKAHLSQDRIDAFIASSELMQHRGPDYTGIWREENLLTIHHRLSILDLDARAHQPFRSANGRFITVYNGEIYNYRELAAEHHLALTTTSDTEVMLETFASKGQDIITTWNGIFACAIFDRKEEKVHLIRDRFGVKPLYIYESDEVLLFASEAKVILDWLPSFSIDPIALNQYLWYGHATGDQTMVKGLSTVAPGVHLTIDTRSGERITQRKFWSIDQRPHSRIGEVEAVAAIRHLMENAVERQLVADVPVGVLLSGGIDSSSIVSIASRYVAGSLDTYTIEYDENINGKSEMAHAALVSDQFGTNHHELCIKAGDVQEILMDLVFQYDLPFGDTASIPMYQLAKLVGSEKRVVLQGDGGDELFGGYRRYNVLDHYWFWRFASVVHPLIPHRRWGERIKRLHHILTQPSLGLLMAHYLTEDVDYKSPYQVLRPDFQLILDKNAWARDYLKCAMEFQGLDRVQQMLYTDMSILLPNRYLEKVDKSTMRYSLEARVPFLDNELADFALSLPASMKVYRGQKKYLLRKAFGEVLPQPILQGPKRGFDVPVRTWLREGLYEFAKNTYEGNLSPLLDNAALLRLLEEHRHQKADYSGLLWKSLMLSCWLHLYEAKIKY